MTVNGLIIISISIIFIATVLGSALVFFFKQNFGPKVNDMILGFAGGIMIAASLFGLINPSIVQSKELFPSYSYLPPIIGFLLGGALLFLMDKVIPHYHVSNDTEEGPKTTKLPKNFKFLMAVTIHNIPEGLAVGFACGLALTSSSMPLSFAALSLAIGIAIQNVPEGAAVSIPMLGAGEKKGRAFLYGSLSGIVEPIFAIIGLFLAQLSTLTPWLLSFAAGAMIYVTLDEIMPEARKENNAHYGIVSFMLGFAIMMILEITLS